LYVGVISISIFLYENMPIIITMSESQIAALRPFVELQDEVGMILSINWKTKIVDGIRYIKGMKAGVNMSKFTNNKSILDIHTHPTIDYIRNYTIKNDRRLTFPNTEKFTKFLRSVVHPPSGTDVADLVSISGHRAQRCLVISSLGTWLYYTNDTLNNLLDNVTVSKREKLYKYTKKTVNVMRTNVTQGRMTAKQYIKDMYSLITKPNVGFVVKFFSVGEDVRIPFDQQYPNSISENFKFPKNTQEAIYDLEHSNSKGEPL
jgi:hypothetical protein